jgi:NADPH2 dehydrogenase
MNNLNSEFTIKNHKIKNRIVMPPMVTFGYADETNKVLDKHIKHYEECAKGGAGIIIIESTAVNPISNRLGLWDDSQIDGISKLAKSIKENEALAIIQLSFADDSEIDSLSKDNINNIKDSFVSAAIRAKNAGVDGIEIHGAHGYLINRFFDERTNKRIDEYGGSTENRTRIVSEIISKVKEACGDDFVIGVRMGCNIPDSNGSKEVAKALEKSGADILHISTGFGNLLESESNISEDFPCNAIVYNGTKIKDAVNIPIIVVNEIKTADQASYLIKNNLTDFVAIGRGILTNPNWANEVLNKELSVECMGCSTCQWFIDSSKCPGRRKYNKVNNIQ